MWFVVAATAAFMSMILGSAASGGYVAHVKGRPVVEGVALGLFLGPMGALVEAILPGRGRPAPGRSALFDPDEPDRVDVDIWDVHEVMGMPKIDT